MSIPLTAKPVTARPCSNELVLERRLACLADAGPEAINARIADLESEWSAGRIGKAVLGGMILVGFALTAALNPYWLILPAVAGFFLLQYLFQRTSWLMKVFQEAGYRTLADIEHERLALKALRGDFRHLPTVHEIEDRDDISRLEGEGGIVVEPEEAKVDAKVAAKEVIHATHH